MMKIVFTESAEQDLLETLHFYRAPSAMGDYVNAIIAAAVNYLAEWLYTGHRRRDLTPHDVCFWYQEPYLIALQINDAVLTVLAVLYGSRNVASIFKKRLKSPRVPLDS